MLNKNIDEIIKRCGDATIVAATKYKTSKFLTELLDKGINNFGENRALDFLEKYQNLKEYDIVWHFIGHLQTNKVSSVINKISYLHSLDSIKLARYIERYRLSPLDCFIELNLSNSTTKYGIKENELEQFLNELKQFKNINVVGLMAMTEEDITYEIMLSFQNQSYLLPSLPLSQQH